MAPALSNRQNCSHARKNTTITTRTDAWRRVCGNGSVPLSHSGNVVTRIGTHTHTHCLIDIDSTLFQRYGVESTLIQSCFSGVYPSMHSVYCSCLFCCLFAIFPGLLLTFLYLFRSFCRLFASFRVFLRLFASFRVFLPTNPYLPGSFCRLFAVFLISFRVFLPSLGSFKYRSGSFCHLFAIFPGLFAVFLLSFWVFLPSFCYLSGSFCHPFSIVLDPIFLCLLAISLLSFRVLAVFLLSF